MEKRYVFRVSSYDREGLFPQVSKALELRMDLLSRAQYPGIWTMTDRLRSFSGGRTRSKTRSRIMGILYLLLGIFLFVPGVLKPEELTGPLLIGAFGILVGIFYLWSAGTGRKTAFERSAKLFLDSKAELTAEQGIEVIFGENGIQIPNENGIPEVIAYDAFECAVEGPDLYLFVFDTRVTVLQKCDLYLVNHREFWDFITVKVSKNTTFS